jgi:Family of unknown function (DUF6263)
MRDGMTRRRTLAVLTFCAVLALLMFLPSATPHARAEESQPFDLRPHGEPGRVTRYEVWSQRTQTATVSLAGNSRTTRFTMTSDGEVTWKIDKVRPDGSMTCTMTLDWLTLNYTDDDGKKHENDSRKSKGAIEPFHALIKAMSNVPIKVTVAPDGTVTGVNGVKAIASKLKSDFKEMVPDDLDFVETASDLATLIAVPASIKPGQNWDADMKWTWGDSPFEGFMHHDATFTLSGVEDMAGVRVAVIDGRSKLKLALDTTDLPEGMPPHTVKLARGDWQSQIMFDLSRGEVVGRNSVQTTTIDVTLRMPSATITRRVDQTLQSQALRIEEK